MVSDDTDLVSCHDNDDDADDDGDYAGDYDDLLIRDTAVLSPPPSTATWSFALWRPLMSGLVPAP